MQNEFVALFKGNSSSKITVHKTIFSAQKSLLEFVKSPECKDIPESVKTEIKSYNDLVKVVFQSAVDDKWDAFVLPVRQLNVESAS